MDRPIFLPVILGTPRQGRASEFVARFVVEQIRMIKDADSELIDVRDFPLPANDAGTNLQNPKFADIVNRSDGLVIVAPEYNHGYPGALKSLLDTNWKEYIHKAVGICGVSAGGLGGTRVIQNLLPVTRELGLVNIFWDGNFSNAGKIFDEKGNLKEEFKKIYDTQIDKFLKELIWMAKVLRYGRENIPLN